MKVSIRERGDVAILDVKGNITIGEGDVVLREAIQDLLTEGKIKLLVNMADVKYIDSAGLGELIHAYTSVSRRGVGALKLVGLQKKARQLLTITKLHTIFQCFDDEETAVQSFTA
ncbi:MAG: STAS domain-containing protein [Candidatus Schekmanbacteria bacterium]|nr:STAS domain-containing protein [Candidatus Schekmanbacteria bacterium]